MRSAPQFFRALADRTRLRIVNLLARGPLCVCDIRYILGQPQSSVSRHLALLRSSELVRDRRDGMRTFYQLTDWAPGLRRGVLETLRRELKTEHECRRDLEILAALKASGECHREGAERPVVTHAPRGTGRRPTSRRPYAAQAGRSLLVEGAARPQR